MRFVLGGGIRADSVGLHSRQSGNALAEWQHNTPGPRIVKHERGRSGQERSLRRKTVTPLNVRKTGQPHPD
jgi:hypothetical protein